MKDYSKLADAADYVARHCVNICGTGHGSAWLFDKLARFFDRNGIVEAVTIPVYLNAPVMSEGEATIHRSGAVELRRA